MAGKDIRLGELLKVIPFVREIHLLFYDGNDEGEPHRKAITSSENAEKYYSDAKVAFIDKVMFDYAKITVLEERK